MAKKLITTKEELYDLYHTQNLPMKQICKIVGCSDVTVANYLHRFGIPLKSNHSKPQSKECPDVDKLKELAEVKKAPMNRRIVKATGADYYPTPAWAIRALLEVETFQGAICEPCCGEGYMAQALEAGGYKVSASDLYDYGYGEPGVDVREITSAENVVTNLPYNLATEVFETIIEATDRKVALLTRMAFLESKSRYPIFKRNPPARVYVFPERLTMSPKGVVVNGGGTVSHCWIVWDKSNDGSTQLAWLNIGHKTKGLD